MPAETMGPRTGSSMMNVLRPSSSVLVRKETFASRRAPPNSSRWSERTMTSNSSGEGDIRKTMVEDDIVSCVIALPAQLFRGTQIPVCVWFFGAEVRPRQRR